MPTPTLGTKPKATRLAAAAAALPEQEATAPGKYGQGMLAGVALCTRGEALGHYYWLDAEFIAQVAAATGDKLKCRFTHPGLSADGLGKLVGFASSGVVDGDVARADLHYSKMGRESPDGDLVAYVDGLAVAHPEAFGLSIVFEHDPAAEAEFALQNGAKLDGSWIDYETFVSPDPLNEQNLPHARLGKLWAADVVDEPAANPGGLFHRGRADVAAAAETFAAYACGLSQTKPDAASFGVDPDRARAFVARFMQRHRGALGRRFRWEEPMPTPTAKKPAAAAAAAKPKPASSLGARFLAWFKGEPKAQDDLTPRQKAKLAQILDRFDDDPVPAADAAPTDDDQGSDTVQTTCPECQHTFTVDRETGDAVEGGDEPEDELDDEPEGDDDAAEGESDSEDMADDEDEREEQSSGAKLRKFMRTFGDGAGARYFAKGLTFEAAASEHLKTQRADLKRARADLAKLRTDDLGADPVAFNDEGGPPDDRKQKAREKLAGDTLSRIAKGCKPKPK